MYLAYIIQDDGTPMFISKTGLTNTFICHEDRDTLDKAITSCHRKVVQYINMVWFESDESETFYVIDGEIETYNIDQLTSTLQGKTISQYTRLNYGIYKGPLELINKDLAEGQVVKIIGAEKFLIKPYGIIKNINMNNNFSITVACVNKVNCKLTLELKRSDISKVDIYELNAHSLDQNDNVIEESVKTDIAMNEYVTEYDLTKSETHENFTVFIPVVKDENTDGYITDPGYKNYIDLLKSNGAIPSDYVVLPNKVIFNADIKTFSKMLSGNTIRQMNVSLTTDSNDDHLKYKLSFSEWLDVRGYTEDMLKDIPDKVFIRQNEDSSFTRLGTARTIELQFDKFCYKNIRLLTKTNEKVYMQYTRNTYCVSKEALDNNRVKIKDLEI